jgi:hypothetical protein
MKFSAIIAIAIIIAVVASLAMVDAIPVLHRHDPQSPNTEDARLADEENEKRSLRAIFRKALELNAAAIKAYEEDYARAKKKKR